MYLLICTGDSWSEALILASRLNPKYDGRFFVELRVQYKKTTSCVHQIVLNVKTKNNLVLSS